MKIEINRVHRQSIESFASMYNLTLKVYERDWKGFEKWYCFFSEIEIKDGSSLISVSGSGDTILEAVKDYCKQLSKKYVVFEAWDKTKRQEFLMPILTPDYEGPKE